MSVIKNIKKAIWNFLSLGLGKKKYFFINVILSIVVSIVLLRVYFSYVYLSGGGLLALLGALVTVPLFILGSDFLSGLALSGAIYPIIYLVLIIELMLFFSLISLLFLQLLKLIKLKISPKWVLVIVVIFGIAISLLFILYPSFISEEKVIKSCFEKEGLGMRLCFSGEAAEVVLGPEKNIDVEKIISACMKLPESPYGGPLLDDPIFVEWLNFVEFNQRDLCLYYFADTIDVLFFIQDVQNNLEEQKSLCNEMLQPKRDKCFYYLADLAHEPAFCEYIREDVKLKTQCPGVADIKNV